MNVALIDPFELHNELPEVVEKRIEPPSSSVTCCTFNRRGNLLAGALCTFHFAFIPSLYTPVKSETSLSLSHTHTHRSLTCAPPSPSLLLHLSLSLSLAIS